MVEVAKFQAMAFVIVLGVVLGVRILRGDITTASILQAADGSAIAGSRVQLLVATLLGAFIYLMSIVESPSDVLPDVPPFLLLAVGASNIAYLGTKLLVRTRSRYRQGG